MLTVNPGKRKKKVTGALLFSLSSPLLSYFKSSQNLFREATMSSVSESRVIARFFKVMVPGFRTKLRLPPAFCTKLKGELPEEAFLTSSKGKWRVEIGQCSPGKICFLDGWASFVEEHDLKIGEFVIFEQTGRNHFKTLLFDSTNCCKEFPVEVHEEEEESSAANTDEHAEIDGHNCTNARMRGRAQKKAACVKEEVFPSEVHKAEAVLEPNLDEYTKTVKRGRGRPRKRLLSPEHREPSVEIFEEKPRLEGNLFSHTIKKRGRGRPRTTTQSLHQEKTLQYNRNHDKKEFLKKTKSEKTPSGKYVKQEAIQMSRRLPNRAAPDGKQNHFLQKIMPYNIERSFIVYIPTFICRSYCVSEKTRISLRGPSREWHEVGVKKHSLDRLCIKKGWREFCASNNVELGDLCFFKIVRTIKNDAQAMSESIVMAVKVSKARA